jgi:S1-C subfamily serine protease
VEPGGPAARAGLEERDVIVELENAPVNGMDDLHRLLSDERVGVPTALAVIRRSERLDLKVIPIESKRNS